MAIGRVSGPMLFANLERQGYDLQFDNGLIYLDVNNRRVGINTANPEETLHVEGNVLVSGNTFLSNLEVSGFSNFYEEVRVQANTYVEGLTVTNNLKENLYSLPITEPSEGKVIGYSAPNQTSWVTNTTTPVVRRSYDYDIEVTAGGTYSFEMDLNAISAIVYNLTVSQPCTVEVHGLPDFSQSNPYTFVATADHLTDDGSVFFSDGSVIQQRQYNIFANLEDPPQERFFVRITNVSETGTLNLSLLYFSAVTGNTGVVVPQMQMEIVDSLPSTGQQGEIVYDRSTDDVYVWIDVAWTTFNTVTSTKVQTVSSLPAIGMYNGQMVFRISTQTLHVYYNGWIQI